MTLFCVRVYTQVMSVSEDTLDIFYAQNVSRSSTRERTISRVQIGVSAQYENHLYLLLE